MQRLVLLITLLVFLGAGCSVTASAAARHKSARGAGHTVVYASSKRKTEAQGSSSHPHAQLLRFAARQPARLIRGRRHHPHTAARLHHARKHGTAAVQEAARAAQMEAAQGEAPANEPVNTASLDVPQIPLHPMNLPPLRGSHESLVRQNQRADQEGLARIQDDADITALLHNGLLVSLPVANGLHADPRLPVNRRYCRPFTARFLGDLSAAYYERFHQGLQVNSAVRTVQYQRHLLRINGNAAPADGDIASPHLTGATIDIAKKGLSPVQVEWMRAYLSPLERDGKIDVEEEFHQSCFHISVYGTYGIAANREQASAGRSAALLANRLR